MSYELKPYPLDRCHFDNIRTDLGSEAELRELGKNLKKRQHHPIVVRRNGQVIDGARRVHAALLVGMTQLLAIITDEDLTPDQTRDIQFETAVHREELNSWDKATFLLGVTADHPEWTNRQIAERLNISESMVGRILSLRDCIPAVQDAVKAGRIGVKCYYEISKATSDEQPALLAKALAGSVEDVARQRRQRPAGTVPAVRTSNLRIDRPTGNVITVKGDGLDLETIAEELTAAAKDARKALADGYDAKTWSSMCRDRAKASA